MRAKFIVSGLGADTDPRYTMTPNTTSRSGLSTTAFSIGRLAPYVASGGEQDFVPVNRFARLLVDELLAQPVAPKVGGDGLPMGTAFIADRLQAPLPRQRRSASAGLRW
jgi:hypothetical protein